MIVDAAHARASGRRWHPALIAAGALALAILIAAAGIALVTGRSPYAMLHFRLQQAAIARGYRTFPSPGVRALAEGPANWLASEAPPRLVLDIPFKHMRKLYAQRERALASGVLSHEGDEYYPASIRDGARTVRVKLRLKGDLTDHLSGEKWSFRIRTRGGDQILGLRRFSLQHPLTRAYQAEPLFLETTRYLGVLTPRYRFVSLTVNGNDLGVMALEEHFSKELLESSGRKDSAIIKFDETDVWAAADGHGFRGFGAGAFDSYRNAEVVPFGGLAGDDLPLLQMHQANAVGLLRGFVDGKLTAEQVFDTPRLGAYLAAIDVWGAWHALRWHNLRFAYGPYTGKLEPIAFDASLQQYAADWQGLRAEPIAAQMLDDRGVRAAYARALARIEAGLSSGELLAQLRATEDEALRALHSEFVFLERYPLDRLQSRAAKLAAREPSELEVTPLNPGAYPRLARGRIVESAGGATLEIENAVPYEIEIRGAAPHAEAGTAAAAAATADLIPGLPLRLPAARVGDAPARLELPLPPGTQSLALRVAPVGRAQESELVVERGVAARTSPVLPLSSVEEQLARHAFIRLSEDGALAIAAGEHHVTQDLIVPRGARLRIEAGATLLFDPSVSLLAFGPVDLAGVPDREVVLGAHDTQHGWPGASVLEAGAASSWRHAVVRDTVEAQLPGWHLTGGVNFYASELRAEHVRFEGSRGEDALNTIHTRFSLSDVTVRNTHSDAFDSDFCTGTVEGGLFEDIGTAGGGDAVDVSGSDVRVTGTRFRRVSDKALSVGEGSRLDAKQVVAEDVGAGAVAKDGSTLTIAGLTVSNAKVAPLMAYVKKPEYGAARLDASGVEIRGGESRPRVQTGSALTLDGRAIPSEEIDVDALYATAMKKAGAP